MQNFATLADAIQEAISKEKEDIALYKSLIALCPADRPDLSQKLQQILDDEIRHIKDLRAMAV